MEIFISLLSGIIMFFIVHNLKNNDRNIDPGTQKRLNKVKNRAFSRSNKDREVVKKSIKILMLDTEYRIKLLGSILSKFEFADKIKQMLKMADLEMTVDIFIIMSIGLGMPFFLIALLKWDSALLIIPLGLISMIIPFIMLKIKIKKRQEKFTQQFPDALGLISSSLRAGHSLSAAFQIVAQEMPNPVNKIFKLVVDDISLGRDTRDALDNMITTMQDSLDLRFFITAVLIQREIGGNLAEILDSLSNTIRERFKLLGQLKAQTSQAKLSGIILAIAPIIIGIVIWFMNPQYMEPLFTSNTGKFALVAAVASAFTGFLVIMKITDIKI